LEIAEKREAPTGVDGILDRARAGDVLCVGARGERMPPWTRWCCGFCGRPQGLFTPGKLEVLPEKAMDENGEYPAIEKSLGGKGPVGVPREAGSCHIPRMLLLWNDWPSPAV